MRGINATDTVEQKALSGVRGEVVKKAQTRSVQFVLNASICLVLSAASKASQAQVAVLTDGPVLRSALVGAALPAAPLDNGSAFAEAGSGGSSTHPAPPIANLPRIEIFGAYSSWYPTSAVIGQPLSPLKNGIVASGTYYLDHHLGWEVEGHYYQQTQNDGQKGGAAGPVFRLMLPASVELRLHGLVGGEKFLGPITPTSQSVGFYANPPVWATTATAGASIDAGIPGSHGHFAVRFEADYQYVHASYGPVYTFTGGQVNVNSYRIAPGLVYRFGQLGARSPKRRR